ncbi:phosphopantetheine-binding protein [Dyella tabacisoli]|uniref:Acyl carrier protein n=1 Tax=Dyella tabacisoli TaxID=2282381 RepID=A0A369UIF0_9GAMM|nr:phosphopantetheine-binding protein [Dyella tabacisoli]RDD80123.1 acyl carrier protein [Dyella tabacisoli]
MTTQDTIAKYWMQILNVPTVEPSDDFISLGGDSIRAVHAANRIASDLGVQIEIAEMFNTLEQVTAHCDQLIRERDAGAAPT